MSISNFKKNCMGTVDFDAKFAGMRKEQDFIAYPLNDQNNATTVKIQSDTRIGFIELTTGRIMVTPPIPGGAYNPHLRLVKHSGDLTAEELLLLKSNIMATASGKAGSRGVTCDNSAALEVFQ